MSQLKFIADSMLGTLARRLRMLGIDTLYLRDAEDSELKYLVRSQDRILLTRDSRLCGQLRDNAWLIHGDGVREEFLSIAENLIPFSDHVEPFSRCLECNKILNPLKPSEAKNKVPPYVLRTSKMFKLCSDCGKVYWDGTHGTGLKEEIDWMWEQLIAGS